MSDALVTPPASDDEAAARALLLARAAAESWYAQREALGFPLLETAAAAQ